jgi:hypothetical protein
VSGRRPGSAYPTPVVASYLSTWVRSQLELGVAHLPLVHVLPAVIFPLVLVLAVAGAWLSRRRLVVLAAGLPAIAVVCLAGSWREYSFGQPGVVLACLLVLIALGGGTHRPGLRWLWPLGAVIAAVSVTAPHPATWLLLAVLALASIGWIAIDARPAVAVAVLLLAAWLPHAVDVGQRGGLSTFLPVAPITVAIAAVGLWRLRKQSARTGDSAH